MAILWRSTLNKLLGILESFLPNCVKSTGPIFIVIGFSLISLCAYVFFTINLQLVKMPSFLYGFHVFNACYLVCCLFFHYAKASFTDPGGSEPFQNLVGSSSSSQVLFDHEESEQSKFQKDADQFDSIQDHSNDMLAQSSSTESLSLQMEQQQSLMEADNMKKCKKCLLYKPERAHHCSVCQRCILKMDHHCPWLNNCVGHYNHRYFILFLCYLFVCILYFAASCSPIVITEWNGQEVEFLMMNTLFFLFVKFSLPSHRTLFYFTFVLSGALVFAIGGLVSWQLYLVASAQTNIEYYINEDAKQVAKYQGDVYINEYDLGTRRNLALFFNIGSKYKWWTIFLPISIPPVGNGAQWLTSTTLISSKRESKTMELSDFQDHLFS